MTNLPATISILNRQIGDLTEKLAPVTDDQVAKAVRSLIASGLPLPASMQADKAPEIYGFALAGVPAAGLQKAIAKVIRGEYDINKSFAPTPPELAAMARAEARVIREDRTRLVERREALQGPPQSEPVSEAGRERVRKLLRAFRRQHTVSRAESSAPEEPVTEAKAAYYQRIMSLSDAPGVGAEELAYRSAIARKVEGSGHKRTGTE